MQHMSKLVTGDSGYMDMAIEQYTHIVDITSGAAVFGLEGCVRKIKYANCDLAASLLSATSAVSFINAFKLLTTKLYAGCGTPALRAVITPLVIDLDGFIRNPPNPSTDVISRGTTDREPPVTDTEDTVWDLQEISKPTKSPTEKKLKKLKKDQKKKSKKVKVSSSAKEASLHKPRSMPRDEPTSTKREARKEYKELRRLINDDEYFYVDEYISEY